MNEVFDRKQQKVPIKIWSPIEQVEVRALEQLKNMAALPFVFKHVAAMPDVHLGVGATVGSVIATKNAVIPAAVGVDIGCGMMAAKLEIEPQRILDQTSEIRRSIERSVPVGHHGNREIHKSVEDWAGWSRWEELSAIERHPKGAKQLRNTALAQLGSLGGGNHFIELCNDGDGGIWVMLHSGSRNIGKSLAEMHIQSAKSELKNMAVTLPDPDLAYYVKGSPGYEAYMADSSTRSPIAKK